MNDCRYEYARKKCISLLLSFERNLYNYVELKELILIDQAQTEQDFFQLLQVHSPILEAAVAFNLDSKVVYNTVQKIEILLEERTPAYVEKLKLIDYTKYVPYETYPINQVKYYLLLDE
ncbi:hypothetical protein CR203_08420 [Salipaludibacillus neizhouensis]|uniref:Uncharacterized protein n=1 Tax=Salipaludibacillus neizhouensis TaxID=885475 RepID=A0A3A9KAB2_9BACI|nr:hypothetical protein [Salipaludibacillus neizhouensis]RKL67381.1 hypothetical protein CR203_08420 [Salipaludibacillus neizhouensis]